MAGTWTARDAIRGRCADLKAGGVEVTSTWQDLVVPEGLSDADLALQEAKHDIRDIDAADAVIFNLDLGKSSSGATHFELGYATAHAKLLFLVGNEHPNIFYYLPVNRRFATWEDCVGFLVRRGVQTSRTIINQTRDKFGFPVSR